MKTMELRKIEQKITLISHCMDNIDDSKYQTFNKSTSNHIDIQDNSNLTLSEKLRDASLAAELEDKLFKSARKYRAFQSRHKMGVRPRTPIFSN